MCVVGLSPVGPLPNFPIGLALSSDQSCREKEGPWEPGVVCLRREAEDLSLLPSFCFPSRLLRDRHSFRKCPCSHLGGFAVWRTRVVGFQMLWDWGVPRASSGCLLCYAKGLPPAPHRVLQSLPLDGVGPQMQGPHTKGNLKTMHRTPGARLLRTPPSPTGSAA